MRGLFTLYSPPVYLWLYGMIVFSQSLVIVAFLLLMSAIYMVNKDY